MYPTPKNYNPEIHRILSFESVSAFGDYVDSLGASRQPSAKRSSETQGDSDDEWFNKMTLPRAIATAQNGG